MCSLGKFLRLRRIFKSDLRRAVIVPLDDALLSGPEGGLRNIGQKLEDIVKGKPDAVMGFPGLFNCHSNSFIDVSCILNITASSTRGSHTRKVIVGSVENALRMGMDCLGVHVNISSKYEPEMLKCFGEVAAECERYGMPLMGIMYPRKETDGGDDNYLDLLKSSPDKYAELVRHAARIGVDLGADIIKTVFTGNAESFKSVVDCCSGIPVIIAGGPFVGANEMLTNAFQAMQAGASGICFGRNVFHQEDSSYYVNALRKIVHEGATVQYAIESLAPECQPSA